MRFKATGSPRGFTLMELMLVLIILTLTIGMVIPRIGAGWKRMEDREFLQEVTQTLKRARLQAMNSGEISVFRIRGSEKLYGLEVPPSQPIPENVDLFADHLEQDPATGDHVILFFPDGSITGSDLEIIFDRQRTFRISIHPLFGTVRLSRAGSP
ncbi:prepilin-type N-terminal cleavage/methylation domain-containing protein [Desulforhabdus amnigena]|jgi:general secretion pathway protein H|nr:prepilin-type N-terminal cleavage/methylation domain-containing protein [Desulforhabdus amnigena]